MDIDLKKYREKFGLTQTDLSKKLGVTLRTVQNYEKGAVIPESIIKLIQYETNSHQQPQVNEPQSEYKSQNSEPMKNQLLNWTRDDVELLKDVIKTLREENEYLHRRLTMLESVDKKKEAG